MAGSQQIQIWIGNYCSWAGFLYAEDTMLSMKPIHVGVVISFQYLRSIFHWKRLQYILLTNLGWIVKCAFQLGVVAGCSEFIIHVRLQVRTWESYRVQRIIVTSVIRFAKKIILWESTRIWVTLISTITRGGQSLIGYAIEKIPHLSHSWFKTKCPFLIPREKKAFLTSILCYRVNSQLPMPFLLLSNPIRHRFFF